MRRQQSLAGRRGVMYVSLDGGGAESCPTLADSAAVSLSQMAFLSMSVSIFSVGQYYNIHLLWLLKDTDTFGCNE